MTPRVQGGADDREDDGEVPLYHARLDAQYAHTASGELRVTGGVTPGIVEAAVDLDGELHAGGIEVEDEGRKWVLPPKPHAELAAPHALPEHRFADGGRLAHLARALNEEE